MPPKPPPDDDAVTSYFEMERRRMRIEDRAEVALRISDLKPLPASSPWNGPDPVGDEPPIMGEAPFININEGDR
jgi:hypothetical protein